MKTEVLRGLLEIVHVNSIRKAAQNLQIPQQTLNKNITSLENELGVKILERTNHGVQLTDAGLEVVHFAKWCLYTYESLQKQMLHTEMNPLPKRQIQLECVNTAIQNIVSRAVAESYRNRYEFELSVIQNTSQEIIENVKNGLCQIGITLQYRGESVWYPSFDAELDFIPIYYSQPYAWVSRNSDLAEQKYLFAKSFSEYNTIRLKENDEYMTNFVFQYNDISPFHVILCDNIHYAKQMLDLNLGIILDMKTQKRLNLASSLNEVAIALPLRLKDPYQMVTGILVRKEVYQTENEVRQVINFLLQQN